MSFLHPTLFAAGLACVAIPIVIHLLLRPRRRPVMWAAMRFLMEAYRRQRRRLRVQQWLLLATRCLLLALLAGALAQPLLERAGVMGSGRTVYVLVDNGLASGVRDGDGASGPPALDRLKERARTLLSSLGAGDRAALISLAGPARGLVVPASTDPNAVAKVLEQIEPSEAPTDIAGGLELVAAAVSREGEAGSARAVVAILSDFLRGSADLSRPLPAALADARGVQILASRPRDTAPGNVQVVGIEPLRPVVLTGSGKGESGGPQREQVRVLLRRTGAALADGAATSLRLRAIGAGGQSSGPGSQQAVRWQPGQAETVVSMQIDPALAEGDSAGAGTALVAEIDRDALAGDNVFRRPLRVREALRVGIVARQRFGVASGIDRLSPAEWLRLALSPAAGTPIDVTMIDPGGLDAPVLAAHDVLLLPEPDLLREEDWRRLGRFVEGGGLLVVSPAVEQSVHLWTDSMLRELGLEWKLAREPLTFEEGIGLDDRGGESAVLSLIAPELSSLSKPVRVFRTLPIEEVGRSTEVLLRLSDGSPWLVAAEPRGAGSAGAGQEPLADGKVEPPSDPRSGRGMVVYLASAPALSWTDLPAKPLMVPLLHELCRQGFGRAAGSWSVSAGRSAPAPARSASLRPIERESAPGAADETVAPNGLSREPQRRAGLFLAIDEGGRSRGLVAVNPDADAGRTTAQEPSAVEGWLAATGGGGEGAAAVTWLDDANPGAALARQQGGSSAALPMLIAVLVLAAIELVMARFFSHAIREGTTASAPVELADQAFVGGAAA